MISVVIPAYQAERFIAATLASVFGQTLRPSEVIVVDDGSTDGTARLAAASGATVISQENGGVARARNTGVQAARNEWVAFLDADDLWETNKLEAQWSAINRFPTVGFVTGNCSFLDDQGSHSETYLGRLGEDYYKGGRVEIEPSVALFERVDFSGIEWIVPSPSALLVKKDVFKGIGYFDEELNGVDDTEFYLRAMGSFPFLFLEKPLVKYRQVSGSQGRDQLLCSASFLKTIDKIAAHPRWYPAGVYETALQVKADRMALYGKELVKGRQFAEARRVLKDSWKAEPKPATFLWWLASLARVRI
jgi:glycosyltransferase involved in cell wall biosynthesis